MFAQVYGPEGANTKRLVRRNQFACPVDEVSADSIDSLQFWNYDSV
jgi:hypothetical protein